MHLNELSKMFYILGSRKIELFFVIAIFLLIAVLDLIGIGLIIPFLNLLLNEEKFYIYLNKFKFSYLITNQSYKNLILLSSSLMFVVFFIKAFLQVYVQYILLKIQMTVTYDIRKKLSNSFFNMPYKNYLDYEIDKIIESLRALTAYITKGVLLPFLKIISEIMILFFIVSFLIFIDFKIIVSTVLFFIVLLLSYYFIFMKILYTSGKKMSIGSRLTMKGLIEGVSGFKEYKVLNAFDYFKKNVEDGGRLELKNGLLYRLISSVPIVVIELSIISFFILLVVYKILVNGSDLVNELPLLGVFAFAGLKLLPKFSSIAQCLSSINNTRYAIPIVYNDLIRSEKIDKNLKDSNNKDNIFKEDFQSFEMKNVDFRYNDESGFVLKGQNLKIKKNQMTCIFGPSGTGKTTLIDIFLKFLEPTSGEIILNSNIDFIKDINEFSWHDKISYIPQKIAFINGSILENITFSNDIKEVDINKFNNSLKASKCDKFLKDLEGEYNYQIGENGIKLSGGQRQRIALARSFYFDRKIIVLDEATNALDNETEDDIIKELKSLKNLTVIIITHRDKVLKYCDEIIYLK